MARVARIAANRIVVAAAISALAVACIYFLAENVGVVPRDFHPIWQGIHEFWQHRSPYSHHPGIATYVHPPSSAALLVVLGVLPFRGASALLGIVNGLLLIGLTIGVWWASQRSPVTTRRCPGEATWTCLVAMFALVISARGGRGNVDILAAFVLFTGVLLLGRGLRADRRSRVVVAGAVVGLACCIKPTVIPAVIGLAFVGNVVAMVVAVVIVVGLNLLVLGAFPASRDFVRYVIPYLLRGEPVAQIRDASVTSLVSRRAPESSMVRAGLAALMVAGAVAAAIFRHPRTRHDDRGLVALATLPILVVFVASSSAFGYYWVYAAPAITICVRRWWERAVSLAALVVLVAPESFFTHFKAVTPIHLVLRAHLFWAFLALFVVIATSLVNEPNGGDPIESQRSVIGVHGGIGSVPGHDAQH